MRAFYIAVPLLFTTIGCSDFHESAYPTAEAARHAGVVERGWLPQVLPARATEIRERHNVDTNEIVGSFAFQATDAEALRGLEQIPQERVRQIAGPHRVPSWWPEVLRGDLEPPELARADLEILKEKQGEFLFAIDWKTGRCFFWSAVRK
jgi:hypothetical protein